MAQYVYQCLACGAVRLVKHSIHDEAKRELPCVCSGNHLSPVKRVIHPAGLPAVIYPGTGFYTSDKRSAAEQWEYSNTWKD